MSICYMYMSICHMYMSNMLNKERRWIWTDGLKYTVAWEYNPGKECSKSERHSSTLRSGNTQSSE